jgi:glycine/D-amino acid oxidase-like deaminating enzyme
MANLYQETAEAAVPTPPLDGDLRTELAVVGGGFTGLSTALHAAERGCAVVLLEAQEPGWGASGRNGGQVNPGLKHDPDIVERDFGVELGGRMVKFAGDAPAFVFDLIKRHDIRCESVQCGTLRAAVRPKHVAAVRALAEQYVRRGAPVEYLERTALERLTGTSRYVGGLLDRRGGALHPLSYARGLARAALKAGARIHGGTRVQRVDGSGADWALRTATGTVTARHVVLATNGYTDGIWPDLRRTIVPVYGAIAATEPLQDPVAAQIMPGRTVLYESGAVTVYYRIDSAQRLLIGGRGPMHEVRATAEIAHILDYARKLWPALAPVAWTHAWGGRLAFTADHYPHIHAPAAGVWIALGYNGRGVALGTAMGRELAERVLDVRAAPNMPVTALKPIAFHGYWPLAVPAAIQIARLRDSLGL